MQRQVLLVGDTLSMTTSEKYLKDNSNIFTADSAETQNIISTNHAKIFAMLFTIEQIADIGNKCGDNPTWANLLDKISELKSQIPQRNQSEAEK